MNRRIPVFIIVFFLIFLPFTQTTFAQSSYVLPYPSSMPGSSLYKIRIIFENIQKYWYFGSFGQIKYNLKQSDKNLVEAKTLFEYKQYLLASSALQKSNFFFNEISQYLLKAQSESKNIVVQKKELEEASLKHIEVLKSINVPDTYVWKPEKSSSSVLNLGEEITNSIKLREKFYEKIYSY